MSNSMLEVASVATESAVDFIKMYHSVTPHEFNLLRPKELQVDGICAPSLSVLPIEEAINESSKDGDNSKLGEYQHENVNVVNEIGGDPGGVIISVVPPPPPLQLQPTVQKMASVDPLVSVNGPRETVNTTLDDSADHTLDDSADADTTIVDDAPTNNISNSWPNRYGKQPSPIYGMIESSAAFKNQLNKSQSEVPALTLNPITNLPLRAYGSDIRWENNRGPTITNSWSNQPAMTINPANNMPLVKPNNAPPAMTMRSLVPLPASMSAAVANSASASLWLNPPNTPVNFNGQIPQQLQQWSSWNSNPVAFPA